MKWVLPTLASLLVFAPVAGEAAQSEAARTFRCTLQPPSADALVDGQFKNTKINFKDKTTPWIYDFAVPSTKPGKRTDVTISSERDFVVMNGTYSAVSVATETYLIEAVCTGPCMFSDRVCGASVQLTDLDSDQAAVAVTPISYYGTQPDPKFFHVVLLGTCKKTEIGNEK